MARNSGRIVHVRGPVVDADFAPESAPAVLRALTVRDDAHGRECALAVAQHLGAGMVRCIAVAPAGWLAPGMEVLDSTLDATTYMSIVLRAVRIYPAVDPLLSSSRILAPAIVGQEHYDVAHGVRQLLQQYREMQERMACGPGEQPATEETLLVARARKMQRFLAQPFFVAEPYTGQPGRLVPRAEIVRACRAILAGECDHLPEDALYMIGSIADASASATGPTG